LKFEARVVGLELFGDGATVERVCIAAAESKEEEESRVVHPSLDGWD
jgi:hypothetical protein